MSNAYAARGGMDRATLAVLGRTRAVGNRCVPPLAAGARGSCGLALPAPSRRRQARGAHAHIGSGFVGCVFR